MARVAGGVGAAVKQLARELELRELLVLVIHLEASNEETCRCVSQAFPEQHQLAYASFQVSSPAKSKYAYIIS